MAASAHLAGVSVAVFALAAAKESADDALSGDHVVRLSPSNAEMVVAALDAPVPASEALRQLMASTRNGG